MKVTSGRVAVLIMALVVIAFSVSTSDQVANAVLFAAFAALTLTLVWRFGRNVRSWSPIEIQTWHGRGPA